VPFEAGSEIDVENPGCDPEKVGPAVERKADVALEALRCAVVLIQAIHDVEEFRAVQARSRGLRGFRGLTGDCARGRVSGHDDGARTQGKGCGCEEDEAAAHGGLEEQGLYRGKLRNGGAKAIEVSKKWTASQRIRAHQNIE
jgi:hypothetical protein